MNYLSKSILIFPVLLLGCKNGHEENLSKFVDSDSNNQKKAAGVITEKQFPVFTPSELPYPFSSAVQVGDILYLSGELGFERGGRGLVPGGIEPETHRVFERIKTTLAHHGLGLEDVFKCTVMLADLSEWQAFNEIYSDYFDPGRYPTRSAMEVSGLAFGARVEMECWAYSPQTD
ncbi:reactive intermediate/imine deaminase [Algoriphagus sp. 4150]|uniref:RidA family protein n=1 Tax=Algoriphagus sp. 4150 TaxID=2817756 RepID=UPI00285F129D|nr:RidA family protein [Algoriphagus sp. 4150]MDR7128115.1 reactive intermediate/imine deaminase [Algoriphagus sp. 4150]